MTTVTFQPQNPALSHYALGWSSCTAYSGAMAASYDRKVAMLMTGGAVRQATGDFSGGTTLAQINYALRKGWNVDLNIVYRMTWPTFVKQIESGKGAILQGGYGPIADSRFDAGGGFRGNHAIFVPPDWRVMDPLADGRRSGIYKYHGEAYPQSVLRSFAGRLQLSPGGAFLGSGYVYAAFTRDNEAAYRVRIGARGFWAYNVVNGVIPANGRQWLHTGGFSASSLPPRVYRRVPSGHSYSLAQLTSGSLYEKYKAQGRGVWVPSVFAKAA